VLERNPVRDPPEAFEIASGSVFPIECRSVTQADGCPIKRRRIAPSGQGNPALLLRATPYLVCIIDEPDSDHRDFVSELVKLG
jgi:hypothetical protein